MTVARSDALVAYLACGWPPPTEAMIDLAVGAVEWAHAQPTIPHGRNSGWQLARTWQVDWRRVTVADPGGLLAGCGLLDLRCTDKASTTLYDTPRQFLHVTVGRVLTPVAVHSTYAAQGVLDEDAVDRAAKRTARALADGRATSIISLCSRHHRA